MKGKIIIFIIGILVGAIIASSAFLIYVKTNSSNCNIQTTGMNDKIPPEMPGGENGMLPEKRDGKNNSSENSKKSKKSSSNTSTDSKTTSESNAETKESN